MHMYVYHTCIVHETLTILFLVYIHLSSFLGLIYFHKEFRCFLCVLFKDLKPISNDLHRWLCCFYCYLVVNTWCVSVSVRVYVCNVHVSLHVCVYVLFMYVCMFACVCCVCLNYSRTIIISVSIYADTYN